MEYSKDSQMSNIKDRAFVLTFQSKKFNWYWIITTLVWIPKLYSSDSQESYGLC